jgi:hypothetical protein
MPIRLPAAMPFSPVNALSGHHKRRFAGTKAPPRTVTAGPVLRYHGAMNSPTGIGGVTSQADARRRLEELRQEHRDLDEVIARLAETSPFNQLQMQRLKKRKLGLKDQMAKLESMLLPDIIA